MFDGHKLGIIEIGVCDLYIYCIYIYMFHFQTHLVSDVNGISDFLKIELVRIYQITHFEGQGDDPAMAAMIRLQNDCFEDFIHGGSS